MKNKIQSLLHFLGFEVSRYPRRVTIQKRDKHFLELLRKFQIDLILDVGAANGGYGKWLRSIGYEEKIISFEPLKKSFGELKEEIKQDERWNASNVALGENAESLAMNVAANFDSSSILEMLPTHEMAAPHAKITHTETVQKITLDQFVHPWLSDSKSIFLKMDVQGYEKQVLEGAKKLLPRLKGIQLEMSLVPLYKGQLLYEEMISHLKSTGFEIYYIRPGFADKEGRLLQCDGIFYRK